MAEGKWRRPVWMWAWRWAVPKIVDESVSHRGRKEDPSRGAAFAAAGIRDIQSHPFPDEALAWIDRFCVRGRGMRRPGPWPKQWQAFAGNHGQSGVRAGRTGLTRRTTDVVESMRYDLKSP